jgi:hypothetical protein
VRRARFGRNPAGLEPFGVGGPVGRGFGGERFELGHRGGAGSVGGGGGDGVQAGGRSGAGRAGGRDGHQAQLVALSIKGVLEMVDNENMFLQCGKYTFS